MKYLIFTATLPIWEWEVRSYQMAFLDFSLAVLGFIVAIIVIFASKWAFNRLYKKIFPEEGQE